MCFLKQTEARYTMDVHDSAELVCCCGPDGERAVGGIALFTPRRLFQHSELSCGEVTQTSTRRIRSRPSALKSLVD